EPEFVELQDHLQQCKECQSAYADFTDLLHNKLPLVDPELERFSKLPGFFSESTSYRARFLTRVRKEGILRSHEVAPETVRTSRRNWFWPALPYPRLATLALATLLVAVGVLGYRLLQTNARYRKLAEAHAALSKQLPEQSALEKKLPYTEHDASIAPVNRMPLQRNDVSVTGATEAELAKALTDRATAEARARSLEDQLANVASAL